MAPDRGDRLPIPLELCEISENCGSVLSGSKNQMRVYTDLRDAAKWRRDELLSLLSTSGEIAGLSIGADNHDHCRIRHCSHPLVAMW